MNVGIEMRINIEHERPNCYKIPFCLGILHFKQKINKNSKPILELHGAKKLPNCYKIPFCLGILHLEQ